MFEGLVPALQCLEMELWLNKSVYIFKIRACCLSGQLIRESYYYICNTKIQGGHNL